MKREDLKIWAVVELGPGESCCIIGTYPSRSDARSACKREREYYADRKAGYYYSTQCFVPREKAK